MQPTTEGWVQDEMRPDNWLKTYPSGHTARVRVISPVGHGATAEVASQNAQRNADMARRGTLRLDIFPPGAKLFSDNPDFIESQLVESDEDPWRLADSSVAALISR